MKNIWILGVLVMLGGAFATACGDDSSDDSDNGPGEDAGCEEVTISYDRVCPHEVGECMAMDDCASGYCEVYSVAPWDTDAVCMDPPPAGTTRFTGVVRDFETNEALTGVVAKFFDGATVIILGAAAYDGVNKFEVTSDVDGRFENDYPWDVQPTDMGIVSIIKEDGYFMTATGFVEPTEEREAPTGVLNHHAMVISESMVATLQALAADDPVAAKYNPNIFGKVLYNDLLDGEGKPIPVQGATVQNVTGSGMQIFYVNENMDGLTACTTASHGMFIIADAATKDKVRTFRGDTPIAYYDSTMGATPPDLVYRVIVPVYSADDPEAPAINCN
jgi:hypothetical protein